MRERRSKRSPVQTRSAVVHVVVRIIAEMGEKGPVKSSLVGGMETVHIVEVESALVD